MPFKFNISEHGKSWKVESNNESIVGRKISDIVEGKDIATELEGYKLKITGASDNSGFPHKPDVKGPEYKSVILTKGWGMHKRPKKAGKKKRQTPDGLRLRKTVRGQQISDKTIQINCIVEKKGSKPLTELFPEQNKPKEKKETPVAN